jgi:hypothetical protein
MRCENCEGYSSRADKYCKRCGAELRNARLPVKRAPDQPTVWRQAAPVLARGAALVALGVIAESAITALAKGALGLQSGGKPAKGKRLPARRPGDLPEGTLAVSETVVMRRLIVRR